MSWQTEERAAAAEMKVAMLKDLDAQKGLQLLCVHPKPDNERNPMFPKPVTYLHLLLQYTLPLVHI